VESVKWKHKVSESRHETVITASCRAFEHSADSKWRLPPKKEGVTMTMLIVFLLGQRFIIQGLSGTAVKG
jgi:hypothetical protein